MEYFCNFALKMSTITPTYCPHISQTRTRCPHTYGVRVCSCAALATEPCRLTACISLAQPPAVPCPLPPVRWTFTFSAKERDAETGLSYFGSRYYSSDLSIWLSVDPMSDKYPSLSPYTYCADNPIKLVDPDGKEVIITGDGAEEAVDQLQCTTKNLIISRDAKTGRLSVEGKARTWEERLLKRSINSTNVKVRIKANYDNLVENDPKVSHRGGAFLGNVIVREEGEKPYVIANQVINPELLCEEFDNHGEYMGESVRHEITEAYMGGVISLRRNKPASMQTQTSRSRIYNAAHNRATPQPNYSTENNNQQIPIDLSKIKFIKTL